MRQSPYQLAAKKWEILEHKMTFLLDRTLAYVESDPPGRSSNSEQFLGRSQAFGDRRHGNHAVY